jgi:hypothetical protein
VVGTDGVDHAPVAAVAAPDDDRCAALGQVEQGAGEGRVLERGLRQPALAGASGGRLVGPGGGGEGGEPGVEVGTVRQQVDPGRVEESPVTLSPRST